MKAQMTFVLVVGLAAAVHAAPQPDAKDRALGDLGKVGSVKFATSCDPATQAEFDRAVALLHSFFYSESRKVFTEVARKDPECAMAYWGIAMSYYHPIWAPPDSTELAAGTAAVEKALKAKKQSGREKEFVHAIEAYYKGLEMPDLGAAASTPAAPSCHGGPGGVDSKGRAACFRREMEKIATQHPDDVEVAAFYSLSLLGTAPPGDPQLKNQTQAAAILEKWYAQLPDHPGLAHYLIHSYDYPPTANKGLKPAQAYADIAPFVPHALHMPSHIFTRLGMWDETIESNLAAAAAGRKLVTTPNTAYFEELHSLDYALYGYLQTARDRDAKVIVDWLGTIKGTEPAVDFAAGYAFGAMPARYALERRAWKEAAVLEVRPMPFWGKLPYSEGHLIYARAVGAAKSGDLAKAQAAADRLDELVKASSDPRYAYFAQQMGLQRRAALGLIAFAKGNKDEGVRILREAAAQEDSLGKHPVSPGAMLPVRELLAEALLDAGKPAEALVEFEASLKIYPARFNAVYGAARSAEKGGKPAEAKRYYTQLIELAKPGDGSRAEVAEASASLKRL